MMLFTLVAVLAVACAIVCGVAWKVAYEDGWEARGLHDRNTRNEDRLREKADFDGWLAQLKEPGEAEFERLAATGELQLLTAPATDTGAFRALTESTDLFLERMAAEEEKFRREITS